MKSEIHYEGTLALVGGYRVIALRVDNANRCFAIGPHGHPLFRTGFASIDEARRHAAEVQASGELNDPERLPPSAPPPQPRLRLEPVMDTILRVEIAGLYIALLGILLGGEAVLWILELPARQGQRSTRVFRDEEKAIEAYESLCAELSRKFIDTRLAQDG
ncbi:MAG TPA: hypothetical protein VKZ99_08795 [Gammaproteobacteria bacterium]|nr:hypothetical protein [Gammaproteobacteria bacterium]